MAMLLKVVRQFCWGGEGLRGFPGGCSGCSCEVVMGLLRGSPGVSLGLVLGLLQGNSERILDATARQN